MALLSKLLHKQRYAKVASFIRGDVLDIGCQQGQLNSLFGEKISRYVGIEISRECVKQAEVIHPKAEFHVIDVDEDHVPFVCEFDVVTMLAVIEHIFNLKILGKMLYEALRPNGIIVLTTPTPFGNDIVHKIGSKFGLFSKIAADDHIVIFNKKRLEIFANEFGFSLVLYEQFQFGCNQIAILKKSDTTGKDGGLKL